VSIAVTANKVNIEPVFLKSAAGSILVTAYAKRGSQPSEYVLVVPPFAEEMNKCRRMMSLLAHRLAICGFGAVVVDLFGTGDSEGDFLDARYEDWLNDLETCWRWIKTRSAILTTLVGIRFGGRLSIDFAQRCDDITRVLMWQPVLSGADALSQFLRLRVAANRISRGSGGESVASLRQSLKTGEPVEVAGYELHPALADSIDRLCLTDIELGQSIKLHWITITADTQRNIPPAVRSALDQLVSTGNFIESTSLCADPFWNTAEITVSDELIAVTTTLISG
jgi:exosortase A-associated hydrolase 2